MSPFESIISVFHCMKHLLTSQLLHPGISMLLAHQVETKRVLALLSLLCCQAPRTGWSGKRYRSADPAPSVLRPESPHRKHQNFNESWHELVTFSPTKTQICLPQKPCSQAWLHLSPRPGLVLKTSVQGWGLINSLGRLKHHLSVHKHTHTHVQN